MRLCHRAGLAVPLLTLFTILAGCATSTTDQPANFNNNPQVVAIYAVDSAFGTLPDVLIFSSDAADAARKSDNPPPSYGSYRIEFDQPINGATVANNADRGTSIGGNASFCSPLANTPVQLLDLQADATRPTGVVTSSVCYDATSPLGSHPHVLIVPGAGALTNDKATPLTCNTFEAEDGSADPATGGNVFKPNHRYGIQVKADIQNAAQKPLAAPTGAGWVNDTFTFTTSGLKIMAAGFIDAATGFFVWQEKPEAGFEKDLAPCATTTTCPDGNGNNNQPTFLKPTDASPFIIVLSEPVDLSDKANGNAALPVTLRRADNSNPDAAATTGGALLGDDRVIEVKTGDTFEPGVSYQVVVPGGLKAGSGDVLASGATYSFGAQPGTPSNLSTTPANGAQAQGHANVSTNVTWVPDPDAPTVTETDPVAVAASALPTIQFSSPVAADAAGKPVGSFTLTPQSGPAVPATVAFRANRNQQQVRLTPTAPLVPATTYTVAWTGVTGAAPPKGPASFNGQPFADDSVQFTTASFRMAVLDSPRVDAATSQANGAATVVNLDRRTDVEPADLKSGNLHVVFNNTTAGVSNSSLTISEINTTTNVPTAIPNFTVAPTANDTSNANFTVTLPATYQQKYGQRYEVRAATSITNPTTQAALKAEGCTAADCSDVKSFTTRRVTASIAQDPPAPAAPTGFRVNFTDPIDPASLTPFLTTATKAGEFKLFAREVSGAIRLDAAGNPVEVPINCVITSPTRVTCTATSPLGNSPSSFVATAVFLSTATQDVAQGGPSGPAVVAPATSTDPSARFTGNASRTLFAPCGTP